MMSSVIPEAYLDLLERPIVVTLVTLMPDYQPQATPIWVSFDGEHVLVNTARNRQKDRNMTERPKVTILSVDPDDPYRYLEIRGVVEEITEEGAVDHINQLSAKYRNQPEYYANNPAQRYRETRVIYKIRPVKVTADG
jgi:PPOX class probable F420-dependent enzyme